MTITLRDGSTAEDPRLGRLPAYQRVEQIGDATLYDCREILPTLGKDERPEARTGRGGEEVGVSQKERDALEDVLAPILESYRKRNPSDRFSAAREAARDARTALAAAGLAVVPVAKRPFSRSAHEGAMDVDARGAKAARASRWGKLA